MQKEKTSTMKKRPFKRTKRSQIFLRALHVYRRLEFLFLFRVQKYLTQYSIAQKSRFVNGWVASKHVSETASQRPRITNLPACGLADLPFLHPPQYLDPFFHRRVGREKFAQAVAMHGTKRVGNKQVGGGVARRS